MLSLLGALEFVGKDGPCPLCKGQQWSPVPSRDGPLYPRREPGQGCQPSTSQELPKVVAKTKGQ